MSLFSKLLRVVCWLALGIYLAAALAFLGVRYWLLPNIDTWRPLIVQQISTRLGVRLDVAHIALDWHRADPVFVLDAVQLRDAHGTRVLHLPRVAGRLSWRGLWRGKLWFQELELDRLELALHRDEAQRISVLNQTFAVQDALEAVASDATPNAQANADTQADTFSLNHPALQWLSQQKRVVLRDAALTWTDASRKVTNRKQTDALPALSLKHVTLVWLHDGTQYPKYQLGLTGQPDDAIGGQFQLKGEFALNAAQAGPASPATESAENPAAPDMTDPNAWDARLYVNVRDVVPEAWRNWLDMPQALDAQRLSAQWWLTVQQGEVSRIAVQADLKRGRWREANAAVDVAAAQTLVQGTGQAWRDWYQQWLDGTSAPLASNPPAPGPAPSRPLDMQFKLRGVQVNAPTLFEQPLTFDDIRTSARLERTDKNQPVLTLTQVSVRNADMEVDFSGRWQPHAISQTGWAALRGAFKRADMTALASYFPLQVNPATRQWLRTGLLGGCILEAPFLLEGELDAFPFGGEQTQKRPRGQWRLDGRFEDATIDYAPPHDGFKGWPKLEQMHGQLAMRNTDLRMTAQRAQMTPAVDHAIALADVQAHIPDLMHDATLNLQGQGEAPAPDWLALVQYSPIDNWLPGTFDEVRADGHWRVPLRLTVPLLNSQDTRARGQIQFQRGRLALFDDVPVFEQVTGALDFSEWSVSTQALRARFLGGDVVVSGGLGTGQNGLGMAGRATLPAFKQAFGVPQLTQLGGAFDYRFLVEQVRDSDDKSEDANGRDSAAPRKRHRFSFQSDLAGVASTLPAPLDKAADARWPAQIVWSPSGNETTLTIQVADEMADGAADIFAAQLIRGNDAGKPAIGGFHRATLGMGRGAALPSLPTAGLALAVKHAGTLDVSAWQQSLQALFLQAAPSAPDPLAPAGESQVPQPFLPVPVQATVQAARLRVGGGLQWDEALVGARYEPAQSLRLDIASTQTAGTVIWSADRHKVAAHFSRLALANVPEADAVNEASDSTRDKDADDLFPAALDLPDIALVADNFSAAGLQLGGLSLQGRAVERERLWHLDSVSLTSPSARLQGQGYWRLRSANTANHKGGDDNIGDANARPPARRGLSLQAELTSENVGEYLREIGLGDVMQGGAGSLTAQLDWMDLPWRLDVRDLSGTIELDLRKGRLSSIRSQSAKLLELLSVQSLQRLLNFDVRPGDIFASGFSFDQWTGTLHLGQGSVQTNDYRIQGAVGNIHLAGDMAWETGELDLQAMVVPRVDMSGASLAAGFVVNPLVGVGAMLTQWLLRAPLSKAMTVHYAVKGNWKDPQIQEVSVSGLPERGTAQTGASVSDAPAADVPAFGGVRSETTPDGRITPGAASDAASNATSGTAAPTAASSSAWHY